MAPSNDIIEYTEVTVQEYFNVMGMFPKMLFADYAMKYNYIRGEKVEEYCRQCCSPFGMNTMWLDLCKKVLVDIYLEFREKCYAEKELTEVHLEQLHARNLLFVPKTEGS